MNLRPPGPEPVTKWFTRSRDVPLHLNKSARLRTLGPPSRPLCPTMFQSVLRRGVSHVSSHRCHAAVVVSAPMKDNKVKKLTRTVRTLAAEVAALRKLIRRELGIKGRKGKAGKGKKGKRGKDKAEGQTTPPVA